MLPDFYQEALKRLDHAAAIEISKLVAAEGASRHDLIRGRIGALSDAKSILANLYSEFAEKELTEDDIANAGKRNLVESFRSYRRGGLQS